jgi:MFS family permease
MLISLYNLIPILSWCIAALYYAFENAVQVSQVHLNSVFINEFGLNENSLAFIISIYFWAYALMQIPVGILIDRYSVNRVSTIAILLCGVGTYLFSISTSAITLIIAKMLIGIGSSFAALIGLYIASIWFEKGKFALLTGMLLTIGNIGSILGEKPLLIAIQKYGWRSLYQFFTCLSLFLAILAIIFIKEKHSNVILNNNVNYFSSLKKLLYSKDVWAISLYGLCMFTPFVVLVGYKGVDLVSIKLSSFITSETERSLLATEIISFIQVGFAVGAPILGWVTDCFNKIKLILLTSLVVTSGFFSLFVLVNSKLIIHYYILSFLIGFSTSGFLASVKLMRLTQPEHLKSTALGIYNTFNMIGSAIMIPFIGYIIHWCQKHSYNSLVQHQIGLLPIILLLYLIGFIMIMYRKESIQ